MSTLTTDEIEHLVMMATCAPSVHNTQPWRFTVSGDEILIARDPGRQLGVIDPFGREMVLSCGAALHHLEVAARALGIDTTVEVDLSGDAVARVRLVRGAAATEAEVATAVAVLRRHTHRGRFDEEPLTASDLARLRHAVDAEHGLLRVVQGDDVVEVEVLVSRAERELERMPDYQAELASWVWQDDRADGQRADGLPLSAVDPGAGRAEAVEGRAFHGVPAARPGEPPTAEHPTLLLLSSVGDAPADWVQAGRALSALLLAVTEAGLLAQPIGQVLDLPGPRRALAHVLGVVGTPQMLLRVGHGTSLPQTPRRPVSEVLTA